MSRAAKSSIPVPSTSRISMIPLVLDGVIVVAMFALAVLVVVVAASRRSIELMPWPDGLEYAASAVNLASGRGAVLHFGGYTYPSRYTAGYPLILEFFYAGSFRHAWALYIGSFILGMSSVGVMFVLARWLFGRAAG